MKVSMPLSYAGGFKESAQQAIALEKRNCVNWYR